MDQSQEIIHAIFASSEYGYHGYRRIARSISNKDDNFRKTWRSRRKFVFAHPVYLQEIWVKFA